MKKQTNQSCQFLLATIIMFGVWTPAFAQLQNNHFALNNIFPVTANENVCLKNAPEISSFTYTKPNSLFAANYDDSPKPDFSAMEQWYEIVKYEYDTSAGFNFPLFVVVVKKKVEKAPIHFNIGWFDADGVRVGIDATLIPVEGNLYTVPVGEPIRLRAYAPGEKDRAKVKSIVVKRILD
jgi:hypothetical protein